MDFHGWLNRTLFIPFYDRRDNRQRLRHVAEIEAFNSLDGEELARVQWRNMLETLRFVSEEVPYYRTSFGKAGISLDDIRAPQDLTKLPTLKRDDIRQHAEALLADGIDPKDLVRSGTGGTISSPIALYLSRECLDQRLAATIAFNKWFGYELGDKAAFVWGAEQDFPQRSGLDGLKAKVRGYLTTRIRWFPTSYLDDAILADYYQRLCKYKPAVIQAYPTPLYLFAKYMCEHNLSYTPKTITVAAETLYDYQREMIESAFKCKVFDWYGSRELGHMASECRMHKGLHINAFHLFVEVIADGRQVFDREGTLVVTDLRNKAMPLVRYEIGDVGVISRRACDCGSNLPILERVSGRLVDTFLTRSGGRVPGVALTNRVIKDCLGIEQMQIVQTDFEKFTVRIVKGKIFSEEDLKKLENSMQAYFRDPVHLNYEFIESIPLEKSGKSRFCICEMDQDLSSTDSIGTVHAT